MFSMYIVHLAPAGLAESFGDAPGGGDCGRARVSKVPEELRRGRRLFGHGQESHIGVCWVSLFFGINLHCKWMRRIKKKMMASRVVLMTGDIG